MEEVTIYEHVVVDDRITITPIETVKEEISKSLAKYTGALFAYTAKDNWYRPRYISNRLFASDLDKTFGDSKNTYFMYSTEKKPDLFKKQIVQNSLAHTRIMKESIEKHEKQGQKMKDELFLKEQEVKRLDNLQI